MLTTFRRYLETWPVRVFFGIMVIAFVVWGVGDVVRQIGITTWLAKVGGTTIEPQQFEATFQRYLSQAERRLPPGQDVTPALRREVANDALQQMIGQAALTEQLRRLRVIAPDAAVRQAVLSEPAFRGPGGAFDRAKMDAMLSSNNLSEPQFIDLMRAQIAAQQLTTAVMAGASAPTMLTRKLFDFTQEKRSALMLEVPFAGEPAPPTPTEAQLQRWYDNHPWRYRVPEFRRIKAVVLTPETYGRTLAVRDADLRAYYDTHKADYVAPERRSVRVVVLTDEAKTVSLAAQWRAGAGWDAIQKTAKADGATAVELDNTTEQGIPEANLARAVFAAQVDTVGQPVKTTLGWAVLKVTQIDPGKAASFGSVRDKIRSRMVAEQAASGVYDAANKVDDILGTGSGLGKLPDNLGLVGVEGTLDAEGNTRAGTPAPIPGSPALRSALIAAAFEASPGQPPAQLTEVPSQTGSGSSYFALTVEQVFPAAEKPFADVKDQVTSDWTQAARENQAERAATKLLLAIKGGQSLPDAAAVAGLTARPTPLFTRTGTAPDVPPALQRVVFGLKPKEPAMVQTQDGFVVAVVDKIVRPSPKDDQAAYRRIAEVLTRSIANDLGNTFAGALRERAHPRINQRVFESFINSQ